jgi:hypothetical protein
MPLGPQRIHDVPDDLLAAIDDCDEQGWTDGLPVIPPGGRARAGHARL